MDIYGDELSPLDARDFMARDIYPRNDSYLLPNKLDLRPDLKPVRNQGPQGSCSAITGECIKEWQEKIDIGQTDSLSPQFVYNLRKNYNASGMSGRDLMSILHKYGIPREYYYPYGIVDKAEDIPEKAYQDAANFKIKGYARIDTIDECKVALFKNGPCYASFSVYNRSSEFWKPKNVGDKNLGRHAATIVGYDDTDRHFIIRNSWGSFWGDSGYTYLPYSEWDMQSEVWTTIDNKSSIPLPVPKKNFTGCFSCLKRDAFF